MIDRFLGFASELEQLLGYRVDLVPNRPFTNPYFRRNVDRTRATIYERSDREAAACRAAS